MLFYPATYLGVQLCSPYYFHKSLISVKRFLVLFDMKKEVIRDSGPVVSWVELFSYPLTKIGNYGRCRMKSRTFANWRAKLILKIS